jgi:hypothetical protein
MIVETTDGLYLLTSSDAEAPRGLDEFPDFPNVAGVSMQTVDEIVYVNCMDVDDQGRVDFEHIYFDEEPTQMLPSLQRSWQTVVNGEVMVTAPLELRTVEHAPLQSLTKSKGRYSLLLCASVMVREEMDVDEVPEQHLLILWPADR